MEIPLYKSKLSVTVDDEFGFLQHYRIYLHPKGYATIFIKRGGPKRRKFAPIDPKIGVGRMYFLHQVIAGTSLTKSVVKFLNGNKLDCRKSNLEFWTHQKSGRVSATLGPRPFYKFDDRIEIETQKKGVRAIIDLDKEHLCKYRWRYRRGYIETTVGTDEYARDSSAYLHHCVAGRSTNPELITDHIDRNPLNNRSSNLRFATHEINAVNSTQNAEFRMKKERGVYWNRNSWKTMVQRGKTRISFHFPKDKYTEAVNFVRQMRVLLHPESTEVRALRLIV